MNASPCRQLPAACDEPDTRAPAPGHRREHQQGFTLIEILIAIVVLAIGVLGVAAMQTAATSSNSAARQIMEAENWASQQIEGLMLLPFDSPQVAAGIQVPDDNGGDLADGVPGHRVSWEVVDDDPMAEVKAITVTVRNNFSRRRVVMTHYKANL